MEQWLLTMLVAICHEALNYTFFEEKQIKILTCETMTDNCLLGLTLKQKYFLFLVYSIPSKTKKFKQTTTQTPVFIGVSLRIFIKKAVLFFVKTIQPFIFNIVNTCLRFFGLSSFIG